MTTLNPGEIVVTTTEALVALIAIFTTGMTGGVFTVRMFVREVNQNDALKLAYERLYMSVPVGVRSTIREVVETVDEAADLLDELTDEELPETTVRVVRGTGT